MPENLDALIAFLKFNDVDHVTCQTEYDPPVVQVDLPAGLGFTLPYNLYQQIREAAGLPEVVC